MNLKKLIDNAWDNKSLLKEKTTINSIESVINSLDKGEIRVAEKINNEWVTHEWIKKAVVLYFPIRKMRPLKWALSSFTTK